MRTVIIASLAVLLCAGLAVGNTVTQQVSATTRQIAPVDRWDVVEDTLYDITNTDLPAIISNLNAAGDGTNSLIDSVSPADGTFTVTTNIVVAGTLVSTGMVTHTVAPTFSITQLAGTATNSWQSWTNGPSLLNADAPAWLHLKLGAEVYVVPMYQLDD